MKATSKPLTRPRVGYECPQCLRPVFLTPPPLNPHASGVLVLDVGDLVRALALHMRVGCQG